MVMRGTRAITIGLAIGLGQAAAWGDPPDPNPPALPAEPQNPSKPAPGAKVASNEYLKAGARLFNKGDLKKSEKYFKAAQRFRNDLSKSEQVVLDTYLEELERYLAEAARPRADPAIAPASMTLTTPAPKPADRPSTSELRAARFDSTDPKQRARWRLLEARDFIRQKKFDEAARKIAEAEALHVTWGRLDDTPEKVTKALIYAREHATKDAKTPSARPLGVRLPGSAASPPAAPTTGPDNAPGS
jgi:hypothetical protein